MPCQTIIGSPLTSTALDEFFGSLIQSPNQLVKSL
nr:MAG TPA: hypothetical protein [Caudoviricetes sp.]